MLKNLWQRRSRPPFFSEAFFRAWAKRLLTLPNLLQVSRRHRALVRRGARLGEDACIGETVFQGKLSHLSVGSSSFIGAARMMLHDRVEIGSAVCINDGVTILTASHDVQDASWPQFSKPVRIGDHAWIATNATILPGVEIGEGAVVGAGSVVGKSIPPYRIAFGNPAVLSSKQRASPLRYSPVRFLAFKEAWLGREGLEAQGGTPEP